MPRKAAKRARTVERDWRSTLFVWRGELDVGGSPDTGPQVSWRGAWLGTDDAMPSDAALKASANTFELKTEPFDEEQIQEKSNAKLVGTEFEGEECGGTDIVFEGIDMILGGMDEEDPEGRKAFFQLDGLFEMQFGGSYKLDNGDGPADYSDLEHEIFAYNGPPDHHPAVHSWAVVGACGDTEFGRFVSLGVLDGKAPGECPGNDTYTRLTLVRRYIADDDPRNGMSAEEVARRVSSCGQEEWAINAPWLALPWKVPSSWPAPLSTPPAFRGLLEAHCEDEGTDWCVGVGPLLQHA